MSIGGKKAGTLPGWNFMKEMWERMKLDRVAVEK
jgi:hypothetical protein